MNDADLSGALIAYIWGAPRRAWPGRDAQAVRKLYGGRSDDLLMRISGVFAVVDSAPLEWAAGDLHHAATRMERLIEQSHPELSTEALHAIAAQFTYSWR